VCRSELLDWTQVLNNKTRLLVVGLASLGLAAVQTLPSLAASTPGELTDAELEVILSKGKIIKRENIGAGVTNPVRLWLQRDGNTVSASFKDVDFERRGMTRFASGNSELNFTDSYKYERAAYLLDRELGWRMVPVTVIRKIYSGPGAVSLWIGNSITGAERIRQGLRPPDLSKLIHQQADMRIFDALIYNTDRHAENQLYTLADWQLHLIDHSRAFRTRPELPESFATRPMTIERSLLTTLEALNESQLKKLLKRELGPTQIKSILARRDLVLEKLEKDRLEYGDAFAFRDTKPVP